MREWTPIVSFPHSLLRASPTSRWLQPGSTHGRPCCSRSRPCTLSYAFVVDIAKFHVVRPWAHRNAKFQTFWMRSSCLYTFNWTFQKYWKCLERRFFGTVPVLFGRCLPNSYLLFIKLRHLFIVCLEGIFDDPKLVADVKEAVATIKKAQYGYEVLWPFKG